VSQGVEPCEELAHQMAYMCEYEPHRTELHSRMVAGPGIEPGKEGL